VTGQQRPGRLWRVIRFSKSTPTFLRRRTVTSCAPAGVTDRLRISGRSVIETKRLPSLPRRPSSLPCLAPARGMPLSAVRVEHAEPEPRPCLSWNTNAARGCPWHALQTWDCYLAGLDYRSHCTGCNPASASSRSSTSSASPGLQVRRPTLPVNPLASLRG
jgi:hypothetical protein